MVGEREMGAVRSYSKRKLRRRLSKVRGRRERVESKIEEPQG